MLIERQLRVRHGDTLKQRGQIGLKIGLEARPVAIDVTRHKPPQAPVGQNAEVAAATVEIPFDLLGRIFAPAADPERAIEAYVPGLGVGHHGRVEPEIRVGRAGMQSVFEFGIGREERVVRFAPLQTGLVDDVPAEDFKNRLNEFLFQPGFVAVARHPALLVLPECEELSGRFDGIGMRLLPLGLKW